MAAACCVRAAGHRLMGIRCRRYCAYNSLSSPSFHITAAVLRTISLVYLQILMIFFFFNSSTDAQGVEWGRLRSGTDSPSLLSLLSGSWESPPEYIGVGGRADTTGQSLLTGFLLMQSQKSELRSPPLVWRLQRLLGTLQGTINCILAQEKTATYSGFTILYS